MFVTLLRAYWSFTVPDTLAASAPPAGLGRVRCKSTHEGPLLVHSGAERCLDPFRSFAAISSVTVNVLVQVILCFLLLVFNAFQTQKSRENSTVINTCIHISYLNNY